MTGQTPRHAYGEAAEATRRAAQAAERRARATWSLIAEPTDAVAMLCRQRLGPAAALDLAREAGPREALAVLGGEVPSDPAVDGRGAAPTARLEQALSRWRGRLDRLDVPSRLDAAATAGIGILIPGDERWPAAIDDLEDTAPHCLWVSGEGELESPSDRGAAALVGSRAATPYGEDAAAWMASALSDRGVRIISGGAYGIDAAAHRGALAGQGAGTLAVLAGGLDALYPRGNARLLETIRARHVLVSEAPPGTAPTRWRFLARNRLIAALAQVTVVIEASWRSGALSTARRADDLSRPVAAVPGPITSAASAGCHRLIRERGAVLVTDASEVLELLPGAAPAEGPGIGQDELDLLSPADRRILDAVPPRSSTTLEALADASGHPQDQVLAAIGRLELFGTVRREGERIRRATTRRT